MLLCVYSELVYNFKAIYTYSSFKRIKSIYKKTVKIVKINQVLYKIEGIHIFKKKNVFTCLPKKTQYSFLQYILI